jgi:hypothetical protein
MQGIDIFDMRPLDASRKGMLSFNTRLSYQMDYKSPHDIFLILA